ncbi:SDR family oxidoreductase [Gluconacetobacter asukensis]|uniref:SDR family oxidoreductase n=1 Tax=Gluconacetobacter asukensis TaxID=1017181 RepID=A0A7W4P353_9PROT|nr:SDR family oxidoreductase [Gluconacetobacter asukensis]MBB2173593.1 SDR family oxidoreductase [Gluconacetobacter asukensis]
MDLNLHGKKAVVLGASRGLGRAIALSFLAEGVHVYATSRQPDDIISWRDRLPAEQQERVTPLPLDLSEPASIAAAVEQITVTGGTDILVNNSGGPPPSPIRAITPEIWAAQFDMMATRIFQITSLLLPPMRARRWGRILTVASSGIIQPIPNLGLSNSIRSAIGGWSKTLSNEVASEGVTVNMVIPGRIHTDRVDQLDALAAQRQNISVEEAAALSCRTIPAARYGRPEEFAAVVTFLASEQAGYITGSQIRVDGGMIRSI